jgi:hypothetical protein
LPTAALFDAVQRRRHNQPISRITEIEFARAARDLGANRLLIVDSADYWGYSAVLFTHRSLDARARLFDVDELLNQYNQSRNNIDAPLATLWESERHAGETEGPGQDLELVMATFFGIFKEYDIEAKSRVFQSFANELAAAVADDLFDGSPVAADPVPSILSASIVNVQAANASFRESDEIVVEASGTPGLVAEALLPGFPEPFSLQEIAGRPGLYRGIIPVTAGLGERRGPVCVRLRDPGYRYRSTWTREEIRIDAPEPRDNGAVLARAATADGMKQLSSRYQSAVFRKYFGASPAEAVAPASQPGGTK